jgi:membrane protease YdiL (CAAX protease family)
MTVQEEKPPAPGLLIPLALLAFAADVLIFYFTIEPLVAWSRSRFATEAWGILAHYGLRALSAALFAGAMVHFRTLSARDLGLGLRPFREDAGWTLRLIACLAIVSLLLIAIAVLVMRLLHLDSSHLQFETRRLGWSGYLLCSIVAAPLVEEFVYRSLLTPALRAGYGDRGAIAAGAALFYVLHLVYAQPWWRIHYAVAGAILTWAFLKRRRLWICVVLHAGGNLLVALDDAALDLAPSLLKAVLGG